MSSPSLTLAESRVGVRAADLTRAHVSHAAERLGLGAFGVVLAALAFDKAGYFPTAWGWSALAFGWLALIALVVRVSLAPSGLEGAWVGGLAALALWIAASSFWSTSATRSVQEAERALLYVAAAAAILTVVRRRSVGALLGIVLAAAGAACAWGLLTRLLPDRFGAFDSLAGYRLSQPMGYWNGMGVLAAIGAALALCVCARASTSLRRGAAAGAVPILVSALYFSFSRGAWIAFAVGVAAAVAVTPRRAQLATAAAAAGLPAAIAVWLASREDALFTQRATLSAAAHQGHRLLLAIVLLALLAAVAATLVARSEWRIEANGTAYSRSVALLALAGALASFAVYGSPVTLAHRGYDAFVHARPVATANLNQRLFSLSGNGRPQLWDAAWHDAQANPWLGSGAGTFELWWSQHRPLPMKVRDAHNLYIEMLAELGPAGLALLAAALSLPLVAAARARRHPLTPAALAAYLIFVVHAAGDWDWELPAVTIAGLACGGALVVCARSEGRQPIGARTRWTLAAAVAAVTIAAFAGLLGNVALNRAQAAASAGDWSSAARWADRATSLAPWSSEPLRRLALAQPTAARARPLFLKAIAKDRRDWRLWLELAWASNGAERANAIAEARRLNPYSPEIREYVAQLAKGRR